MGSYLNPEKEGFREASCSKIYVDKAELRENTMLPQQFLDRMEKMLKEEYPDFLAGYDGPKASSLRVNALKGTDEELKEKAPFQLRPVPWAENGYYYKEENRPGRHPFHEAGVYYIQEASAMAPVVYLNPQPGEKVLDLCAAPGGKSTQIAAALKGWGLLVSNEIHPQRARILSENIERMGVRNALVVSHAPADLEGHFQGYFDRILVDAPCSGEGMFRKNQEAVEEWSPENVEICARRQDDILESAAVMLRPGGKMVYSTCTFAPQENEGTISRFLKRHPEFQVEKIRKYPGMSSGSFSYMTEAYASGVMQAASPEGEIGIEDTIRLWPHKLEGEGHFLACLKKEGQLQGKSVSLYGRERGIFPKDCKEWQEFKNQYLKVDLKGVFLKFGDQLYLLPEETPSLRGLRALRPGLHLGTLKKNRFEPAHALALALKPQEVRYGIQLSFKEAAGYLSGQTFPAEGEKGWYLVNIEGYSLGWGKLAGGIMKNHYPKGLRK